MNFPKLTPVIMRMMLVAIVCLSGWVEVLGQTTVSIGDAPVTFTEDCYANSEDQDLTYCVSNSSTEILVVDIEAINLEFAWDFLDVWFASSNPGSFTAPTYAGCFTGTAAGGDAMFYANCAFPGTPYEDLLLTSEAIVDAATGDTISTLGVSDGSGCITFNLNSDVTIACSTNGTGLVSPSVAFTVSAVSATECGDHSVAIGEDITVCEDQIPAGGYNFVPVVTADTEGGFIPPAPDPNSGTWSSNPVLGTSDLTPGASGVNFNPPGPGVYTINYSIVYNNLAGDPNCVIGDQAIVTVLDDDDAFITGIPGPVVCSDGDAFVITWGPPTANYVITGPNGFISTTLTNINPATLPAGTYNVFVELDPTVSCATASNATATFIIIDAEGTGAFSKQDNFVCQSETDFSIDLTEYLQDGSTIVNGGTLTMGALPPMITELDYAQETPNEQDFVEVTVPAGTDLCDYALYFYERKSFNADVNSTVNYNLPGNVPITVGNTSGAMYQPTTKPDPDDFQYRLCDLPQLNPGTENIAASNGIVYEAYAFSFTNIKPGPAAIALVYVGTEEGITNENPGPDDVVQFLGYGFNDESTNLGIFTGCMGPARGLVSHDINVTEAQNGGRGYSLQFTNAGWVVPNVDDPELNYPALPDPFSNPPFQPIPGYLGERWTPGSLNWGLTGDSPAEGDGGADALYWNWIAPMGDVLMLGRLDRTLFIGGQTIVVEEFDPATGDPADNDLVEFSCEVPTYTIPFNYGILANVPCVPADQLATQFDLTVIMDVEDDWMSPMVVCENADPINLTHLISDDVQWIQPVHKQVEITKTESLELNNYPAPFISEFLYNDYGDNNASVDDHCVIYNYIDLNDLNVNNSPTTARGTQRFCEGVEISGLTGTDLSCYALVFYDRTEINAETDNAGDSVKYALMYDVNYINGQGLPQSTDVQNAGDDFLGCPWGGNNLMRLYGNIDTDECGIDYDQDLAVDPTHYQTNYSTGTASGAGTFITAPITNGDSNQAFTDLYGNPYTSFINNNPIFNQGVVDAGWITNYNGPSLALGGGGDFTNATGSWNLNGNPDPTVSALWEDANGNGLLDANIDILLTPFDADEDGTPEFTAIDGTDGCTYLDDFFVWEQCEDAPTSDDNIYTGTTYSCSSTGREYVGARWFPIANIHDGTGAIGLVNTCNCELLDFISYGPQADDMLVASASDFSLAGPFADKMPDPATDVETAAFVDQDPGGTGYSNGDLQSVQLIVDGATSADLFGDEFAGGIWMIADGDEDTDDRFAGVPESPLNYDGSGNDSQPLSNTIGYYNCALDPSIAFPTPACVEVDLRSCVPDNFIVSNLSVTASVANAAAYQWILGHNDGLTNFPLYYNFACTNLVATTQNPATVPPPGFVGSGVGTTSTPAFLNNQTNTVLLDAIQSGCSLGDGNVVNNTDDADYDGYYDNWEYNCESTDECIDGGVENCFPGERFPGIDPETGADTYTINNPGDFFEGRCSQGAEKVYKFCVVGHPVGGSENYTATLTVNLTIDQCAPIGNWSGKGVELYDVSDFDLYDPFPQHHGCDYVPAEEAPEQECDDDLECLWLFNPAAEDCYGYNTGGGPGSGVGLSDCSPVQVTYNTAVAHDIQDDNSADDMVCLDDDNELVRTQNIAVVSAHIADLIEDQSYCLSDLQDGLFGDGIDLTEFLSDCTPADGVFNVISSPSANCYTKSGYIFYPECVGSYSIEHVVSGSGLCEDRDTIVVTVTEAISTDWAFIPEIMVDGEAATVCNNGVMYLYNPADEANDLVNISGTSVIGTHVETASFSVPAGVFNTTGSVTVSVDPADIPCGAEIADVRVTWVYQGGAFGDAASFSVSGPAAFGTIASSNGQATNDNASGSASFDDFTWSKQVWNGTSFETETMEGGLGDWNSLVGDWTFNLVSASFPWSIQLIVEVDYVQGSFSGLGVDYLGDGVYTFNPGLYDGLEMFNNIEITYEAGCGESCSNVEPATNLIHVSNDSSSPIVATAGCPDANGNVVVSVSYTGGGTLTWGPNNIPVTGGSFTVNSNTTNAVTIYAAEGFCTGSTTVTINDPIVASASAPGCGDTNVSVSVSGGAGAPYYSSIDGGNTWLPVVNNVVAIPVGVQTTIIFTDASQDCYSNQVVVTAPTITPVGTTAPLVSCNEAGTSATVSFSISGGAGGPYFVNGQSVAGTTFTATGVTNGTYTYTVTSAAPCSTPTQVTVTVNCIINVPLQAQDDQAPAQPVCQAFTFNSSFLLGNDSGSDITVQSVCTTSANGGTIMNNGNGTWTYMPNSANCNSLVNDSFCYTIVDQFGQTDDADVTITFVTDGEESITATTECEYEDENNTLPTGYFDLTITVTGACDEYNWVNNVTGETGTISMSGGIGFLQLTLASDNGGGYDFTVTNTCTGQSTNLAETVNCAKSTSIDLISFEGEAVSNGNQIVWVTATEVDNDYFTLEHSTDGTHFDVIATVDGAGDSQTTQVYNYLHGTTAEGVHYYRLSYTDEQGRVVVVEKVVTVVRGDAQFVLGNVYPVPSSNDLNVEIIAPAASAVTMRVYDVTGKLVDQIATDVQEGFNKVVLDLRKYAVGNYFLTVTDGKDVHTTKFIKD